MKKTVLILALLAVAALLPGPAAGETSIGFNESDAQVYKQVPAENPSVGEYYWITASKFSHNVASRVEREAAKTVDCYPYPPFVSSRVLPREMAVPHVSRPTK